jgi:hypothetical protein
MWVASAYANATVSAAPTSNLISFLDIAAASPFSKNGVHFSTVARLA